MATLTGAMLRYTPVQTVGLCHSVQVCTKDLFESLEMDHEGIEEKIAGINHMAWLLEVKQGGKDLYPDIKRRAKKSSNHDIMIWYVLS